MQADHGVGNSLHHIKSSSPHRLPSGPIAVAGDGRHFTKKKSSPPVVVSFIPLDAYRSKGEPMSSDPHKPTMFAPITQAVARKLAYLTGGGLPEMRASAKAQIAPREAPRTAPKFFAIAILNSKGGVGKSTTAVALAAAAHCAGERAAIVDCDLQQHTARDWWLIRRGKPKVVLVGPIGSGRLWLRRGAMASPLLSSIPRDRTRQRPLR